MNNLTAQLAITLTALLTKDATADSEAQKYAPLLNATKNFSNGEGDDQANQLFIGTRTLTADASEDINLSGSLVDVFGDSIAFTKVKAIIVQANGKNENNVIVQRGASNSLALFIGDGGGIELTPDAKFIAMFPDAAGIPVVAGAGDTLTISNSAGDTAVTYTIAIIGTV